MQRRIKQSAVNVSGTVGAGGRDDEFTLDCHYTGRKIVIVF